MDRERERKREGDGEHWKSVPQLRKQTTQICRAQVTEWVGVVGPGLRMRLDV